MFLQAHSTFFGLEHVCARQHSWWRSAAMTRSQTGSPTLLATTGRQIVVKFFVCIRDPARTNLDKVGNLATLL